MIAYIEGKPLHSITLNGLLDALSERLNDIKNMGKNVDLDLEIVEEIKSRVKVNIRQITGTPFEESSKSARPIEDDGIQHMVISNTIDRVNGIDDKIATIIERLDRTDAISDGLKALSARFDTTWWADKWQCETDFVNDVESIIRLYDFEDIVESIIRLYDFEDIVLDTMRDRASFSVSMD